MAIFFMALFCLFQAMTFTADRTEGEDKKPRARDLGIEPGVFPPGPYNAITDVPGVLVGHTTIRKGDNVRTGVTAVLPHGGNIFLEKVTGAVFVGNAFGKLAGSTQVNELGLIETPIILTNTLSVGRAVEAVVDFTLNQEGAVIFLSPSPHRRRCAGYPGTGKSGSGTSGMGRTYEPIPIDKVKNILTKYGRGKRPR